MVIVRVAVPCPLFQLFDYRWSSAESAIVGARVRVPFGRRTVLGIIVALAASTDVPETKLRAVTSAHDSQALIPVDLLELLSWASRYYLHPIGDVLAAALPAQLRKGQVAELSQRESFSLIDAPLTANEASRRAPLQRALLALLQQAPDHRVTPAELRQVSSRWRAALKPLIERGLVKVEHDVNLPASTAIDAAPTLMAEQHQAVAAVTAALGTNCTFLLNGVTGSGKTEVYLRCINHVQQRREQVLILVPEISLTPQLMRRFARRISGCLVSLHSALTDSERTQNWLLAAQGYADVVIGTRSAVMVPMPRLGLIIIDEEHDGSLKQQDGFRYHARDMALVRARICGCPTLLGTATPSFESLNNVAMGRYQELALLMRAGGAKPPVLALLDIRRRPLIEGLSDRLLAAIGEHLGNDAQVLIFINRRGFAPTLLCNDCGASSDCKRCDAHMTVHAAQGRLRCHHCGADRPMPATCEECGSDRLDRIGYGTQRIASALEVAFPGMSVARIDRDSTRRKGELQKQLDAATSGAARILVGTQMLAKGHHFPGVTLVGILDADRGLFGTDFRSLENMGQLIVQVAGRAGREQKQGTVMVQTRNPDNPMLQTLVSKGYAEFAKISLADRRLANLPPYSYVALVRAEATDAESPLFFLRNVAQRLAARPVANLQVMGPAPAPMERLGGRFRAQLLIQSDRRSILNECLSQLTVNRDSIDGARRTRWSIDVDPVDLF